jgi:hypothetical protein
MNMRVCFDVHGKNARELRDSAEVELRAFFAECDTARWRVEIDVHQEAASFAGTPTVWRGEVTAECDDV